MPTLALLAGWMNLEMRPQTFTELIISLKSLIARKKRKNGLFIGLEPEQFFSILSWLRTGLDSIVEGFLGWDSLLFVFYMWSKRTQ
jgi:sensor histidine kinase regulating citrate/malate metabolism